MADERSGSGVRGTTPREFPETTPPAQFLLSDYSFTLQTIMELQKAVGALTQAVTTLTNEVAEQGRLLDRISHRVYAAGVVLAVAAPIIIFLANL